MNNASKILKRMKTNRKINLWWLRLFIKFRGVQWLKQRGLTPQAIGVWINPYTSNTERIRILKFN